MFHFGNQGGPNLGPIGHSVQFKNQQVERGPLGEYFFGKKSLMPYVFGEPEETHRKKRTRLNAEEQAKKYPNRPRNLWWGDDDEMEGPHTLRERENENGPVELPPPGPYHKTRRTSMAKLATRQPRLARMTPDEQAEYFREKYPSQAAELQKRNERWYLGMTPLLNVLSRSRGGGHTKKKRRSRRTGRGVNKN
jgi:hypothetical protein